MKKTKPQVATPDVKHSKTQTNPTVEVDVQTSTNEQETKKKKINEAREQLKAKSREVRKLVEDGKFETINDALIETVYNDETHHEFKSYKSWKSEGFQVRKGEKGFLLWGRPKQKKEDKEKPVQENAHKEEHDPFYPLAFAFSDAQVDPVERNKSSKESKTIEDLANLRNENAEHELELAR